MNEAFVRGQPRDSGNSHQVSYAGARTSQRGLLQLDREIGEVALREDAGIRTSYLRLRGYPFSPAVEDFIRRYDRVYVVEQNRDAQMLSLLKIDVDAELAPRLRSVLHYSGLPIDARSVTEGILAKAGSDPFAKLTP